MLRCLRVKKVPRCGSQWRLFCAGQRHCVEGNKDPKNWDSAKVRRTFIDYFVKEKGHVFVPSSPVIPHDDPSLLFANAGMNQFKPIFLGTIDPKSPLARLTCAVNSQKCIRAGGKHNDLADVGKDTYHHTFFEMLGTWSFNGAYSQKEAIDWAFTLLTHPDLYGLDKDRLYVSYFGGDEEFGLPEDSATRVAWLQHLPLHRVLPFKGVSGENFWEMGDTGPCGTCTEIHYDRIGSRDATHLVNADDPNVLEIWNLVFMRYNREVAGGKLVPLPALHIDTGMGLERITSILKHKTSNYDTDIFTPIMDAIHQEYCSTRMGSKLLPPYSFTDYEAFISKSNMLSHSELAQLRQHQQRDLAYRVIADHLRTASIAIADGVRLSSVGRGYVIRRVLRRALRYAQFLSKESLDQCSPSSLQVTTDARLSNVVPVVIKQLGVFYPELIASQKIIVDIIKEEEESFAALLKRGLKYLEDKMTAMSSDGSGKCHVISGNDVFFLYDSLGFPVDLTELIVEEFNEQNSFGVKFRLDLAGYKAAMQAQKDMASAAHVKHKQKQIGLGGESTLVPSINALNRLKKEGIKETNDSFKFYLNETEGCHVTSEDLPNTVKATILKVFTQKNDFQDLLTEDACGKPFGLLLNQTSFYAEGGGQVCDTGTIRIFPYVSVGQSIPIDVNVVDVQSHGDYILHTCIFPSNELPEITPRISSGSICELYVDEFRRTSITPNHTMTHILNYILRKVLKSDSVDQRGSLVSSEKLRFDFSFDKALTLDVMKEIENQSNGVIQEDMPVHTAVVPLETAKRLPGVRAVFGETYPDPVRVVSIGPSLNELDNMIQTAALPDDAAPSSGSSCQYSIEFCGGTHLQNTGQAKQLVIVDESAIAKGVRRITALSGDSAVAALQQAESFSRSNEELKRLIGSFILDAQHSLRQQIKSGIFNSTENCEIGKSLEDLQGQVINLKESVTRAEISITVKNPLKLECQKFQKELIQFRKVFIDTIVEESVANLLEQCRHETLSLGSQHFAVLEMTIPPTVSCEMNMIKRVTQRLKEENKNTANFSFIVICHDIRENKLKYFSSTAEKVENDTGCGLNADEWVKAVADSLGGKGGGKNSFAQGSVDTAVARKKVELCSGDSYGKSERKDCVNVAYNVAKNHITNMNNSQL